MRQFREIFELIAVRDGLDLVVRQVNCAELKAVLEAFDDADIVVREVEHS